MNGILNILKPPGMTSFDVVSCLRGILKTRKIGHAGTLDPMAAGVLPVCVGRATKAIEYIMGGDKLYRAELTLGVSTDTQDSSGRVLTSSKVEASDESIKKAVESFKGTYMQIPPMYSAVRVNGKKLYEMARKGLEVDRSPREAIIHSIEILEIKRYEDKATVLFDIHCSKGTYIRTLCSDIGEKLGCGGHMSFLLRKKAGIFSLDLSVTIEEVIDHASRGDMGKIMMETDSALEGFEIIRISGADEKKFVNGSAINIGFARNEGLVRVYGEGARFLAVGEITRTGKGCVLKSRKLF